MSKAVRFLEKQSPYNAGEVAGFSDEIAQKYVDAKIAEWYQPGQQAEANTAEEKPLAGPADFFGSDIDPAAGRESEKPAENISHAAGGSAHSGNRRR